MGSQGNVFTSQSLLALSSVKPGVPRPATHDRRNGTMRPVSGTQWVSLSLHCKDKGGGVRKGRERSERSMWRESPEAWEEESIGIQKPTFLQPLVGPHPCQASKPKLAKVSPCHDSPGARGLRADRVGRGAISVCLRPGRKAQGCLWFLPCELGRAQVLTGCLPASRAGK